jgi:integrator complex subunit 6
MAIDEIPFDKYKLEPSPLTQFLLERRQPNIAWQCFVPNSGSKPNDLGSPFGYLKASSNMMTVNLFVMPYNYPVLYQLISMRILENFPTNVHIFFRAWSFANFGVSK